MKSEKVLGSNPATSLTRAVTYGCGKPALVQEQIWSLALERLTFHDPVSNDRSREMIVRAFGRHNATHTFYRIRLTDFSKA